MIWSPAWGTAGIPILISSITPDVMASLRQSHFFEKLDDVLSPLGGAATQERCDYKLSQSILHSAGYDSEAVRDVFAVLRNEDAATARFSTMSRKQAD
jgi:hypothetical protein